VTSDGQSVQPAANLQPNLQTIEKRTQTTTLLANPSNPYGETQATPPENRLGDIALAALILSLVLPFLLLLCCIAPLYHALKRAGLFNPTGAPGSGIVGGLRDTISSATGSMTGGMTGTSGAMGTDKGATYGAGVGTPGAYSASSGYPSGTPASYTNNAPQVGV